MKKLFSKLNNRRGASILMALLLFLICALAGAAALTAAGSNIGRYSYLEEDQQQYLAVSSAAKLFREQLDGLEASADFEVTANNDASHIDFPRNSDGICTSNVMEYLKSEHTPPTVKYSRGAEISDPDSDIVKFFKDNLDTAVNSAFYSYINDGSFAHKDIWDKAGLGSDYPNVTFSTYNLSVTCDGLDFKDDDGRDVEVKAEIKIDNPSGALKDGDALDVKITVSLDNTKYELSGELKVKVTSSETSSSVTRNYVMEDTGAPAVVGVPNPTVTIPVTSNMVTSSKVTASVTFDIDNVISRVPDGSEGGDGV